VRTFPVLSFPDRWISWLISRTVRRCGIEDREEEWRAHSAMQRVLQCGFRAERREGRVLGVAK
jgi:hypothetical protein